MAEVDPTRTEHSGSQEGDPVWTFRGYRLRPSDFNTAMVHFFRAEVARSNVWRQRLDTTFNWAVVTTGAALTFAFSQTSGHHAVLILNILLVTLFLYIEARRYRYYELWSYRVRLMETDFFAAMLVPPFQPDPDWAESLAENLLHPDFPITSLEAIGRRLRRNYFFVYIILGIAWISRIWLLPTPAASLDGFIRRAAVGPIRGEVVMFAGAVFILLLTLVGIFSLGLHAASGEVLPRFSGIAEVLNGKLDLSAQARKAWFRPSRRRQQLMALIITDRGQEVAAKILKEMRRGVTSLPGTGMYTGKAHAVLMVALTVTEANHLKSLVNSVDPKAFMIVTPVQELLGSEFTPIVTK